MTANDMDLLGLSGNAATLFFCWLFARAALHKLALGNAGYYRNVVAGYGIAAGGSGLWLARVVGLLELIVALSLLLPASRTVGATLALLLLAGYALLMSWQLTRGKTSLDCGCAGSDDEMKVSWHLILRNALLCLLALLCLAPATQTGFGGWLFSAALGSALLLIYMSVEQLIANWQKMLATHPRLIKNRG